MLNPEEIAKLDQAKAYIVEALPPLWYGLYFQCVEQGFSDDQAMQCVLAFIHASCGSEEE